MMMKVEFGSVGWLLVVVVVVVEAVPTGNQVRVVPCTTPGVSAWSLLPVPNTKATLIVKNAGASSSPSRGGRGKRVVDAGLCLDCLECVAGTLPVLAPCNVQTLSQHWTAVTSSAGTVLVFEQKSALEDDIGSHACSLEVNMRVINRIPRE
jgi:hypothetical protein